MRMTSTRRRLALTAAAALVAGGAACTTDGQPDPADAPQRFHTQKLAWQACTDFATSPREAEVLGQSPATCAWLTVPLNYDDPQGATTTVAVLRFAARGARQGSLVFNPGGPGGTGVLGAVGLGVELPKSRITERFDVIGFDPRGVGATKPAADCWTEGGKSRGDQVFPLLTSTASLTEEDTRAVFERCAQGSGGAAALTQMGTRTTARDMDVLRSALGEEKLTFLGQSYGSRLGAVYAEQFPQRVRAMVLDGAFDPDQGTIERRLSAYGGFQRSFEAMAATCAKKADCPLGTDPETATSRFQSIVQPLREKPVPARDRKLDFETALAGVTAGLYSPDKWPTIISGLAQAREGRGDTLLKLTYDYGGANPDAVVNGNFTEAAFAINCMDEQRLTPSDAARLRVRTYEVAPFMNPGGDPADGARDGCEFWPAPPTLGIPYAQNVKGLPDTLVVSITGDPTTPHQGAVNLAGKLGSALLTVEGEGHTVVSSGKNTCVEAVAADYLIDLKLPARMPTCAVPE